MRNLYSFLVTAFVVLLSVSGVRAQLVGDQIFLPGRYIQAGIAPNASMGSVTPSLPTGYYSRSPTVVAYDPGAGTSSSTNQRLMMIFDAGRDGWTSGTPTFFGDYSMPGSPFETWAIQVNGVRCDGSFLNLNTTAAVTGFTCASGGTLTGTNVSYSNSGGTLTGVWYGTAAAGALQITQTFILDTTASWLKIYVKLKNVSGGTLSNVYYMRSTDPDNDQTSSGIFNTRNVIDYQNDYANRVQVTAWGTSYTTQSLGLSAKDCRARCFYGAWPTSTATSLAGYHGGTVGGCFYSVGSTRTNDDAIGIVFNLGNIAAGDSATFNYAYVYNGTLGLDSAIIAPQLLTLGRTRDSTDTITSCAFTGDTLFSSILNGNVDNWAGSTWTWAPSRGLIATTGLSSGVVRDSITSMTTYTITGVSSAAFGSCATRRFYLTVLPAGATPPPIVRDTSYCLGATAGPLTAVGVGLLWYTTSSGGTGSSTAPTPLTTTVGSTKYYVSQTVAGCASDRDSITVTILPLPAVITGPSVVCAGSTITVTDATTGGTWSALPTTIATIGSSTGIITGVAAGTAIVTYSVSSGCRVFDTILVNPLPLPITGFTTVCSGVTTTLSNSGGGTWSSSTTTVATVGTSSGIVSGVSPGTSVITYTLPTTCRITTTVLVNPSPTAVLGTRGVCHGLTTTLSDATVGGTWSSSDIFTATIGTTSGVVTGVTPGTSIISYTYMGCWAFATVTVHPLPTGIAGPASICEGANTTLMTGSPGGTWTSSTPSVATINTGTGVVYGVAAGTTSITYRLPTGCISTTVLTVNPIPAPITGTARVCVGLTTTLTNSSSGGSWSSSNVTRATIGGTTGVVTGISSGTAVISYSYSTGCAATIVVTINPLPAPITGVTSICVGTSSSLANTSTGGTWSTSNTNTTIGASTGVVTGITAGSSIITYMLPTGCINTTIVNVNNAPAPISGITTICTGARTTLSTTTAGGTWGSSATTVASVVSSSGVVTGVSAGTAVITYRVFTTGCIATVTVTVTALPRPISGITSLCLGTTTTLTDTVTGGVWTSSTLGVATIGSSSGVVSAVATGTSTITYSLGTGCTVTRVVTVNPSPGPILGITGMCTGATVTLSNSVSGGTWSSALPSVASVTTSTGYVTGVSVGTTTVTYTLSSGCSVTTMVTVTSGPGAITGPLTICVGTSATLTSATGGGAWSSGATGIATIESSTGIVRGVSVGSATITYSLGGGCQVTRAINVTTPPTAFAVTGGGSYCAGGTGVAIGLAGSSTGVGYVLYFGSTAVGATVAGTGGALSFGLHTVAGTYTIVGTSAVTGCSQSMTGSAVITINPLPAPISGGTTVCVGSTSTLTSSGSGTWSSSAVGVATIGTSTGVFTGVAFGTSVITYTASTGCIATTTVNVSLSPGPITGFATVCTGMTSTLSNSVSGGVWSSSCAELSIGTSSGVVTGLALGTCTVTYSLGSGCSVTRVIAVTPSPGPILGSTSICTATTSTLSNSVPGGSWSSSSTSVASVSTGGVVTGGTIGTATITYSLGVGCFVTTVVTVSSGPSSIFGTASICNGTTTTLTNSVAGGTWSSSCSELSVDATTGVVTGMSAGTCTVSYTVGGTCFATRVVTVLPAPGPIVGPTAVCLGACMTLSNTVAGGTWTSSSTSVATVSTTGVVCAGALGTTVISYSIGTSCIATSTVAVSASPTAIGGPSSVCVGQTVTLSNGAPGGVWSSTCTDVSVGSSSGIVTGLSAGICTITYSLGTGCTVTRTIAVNPIPGVISGLRSMCVGSAVTLSIGAAGGTWSSGSGGVATIVAPGIVRGVSAGTAAISYSTGSGCASVITVTVNPSPATIGGTTTVCANNTTVLTNSVAGGVWSTSGTIATVGSSSGVVTGLSGGLATITYTIGGTCATTTTVRVNPIAPITGGTGLCMGLTTTLSNSVGGGTWSSSSTCVTVNPTTGVVYGSTVCSAVITYMLPTGCFATTTVTVNSVPTAILGSMAICQGTTYSLSNATVGGTWMSSPSTVATIGVTTGVVSGVTPGVARITYSLGSGCQVVSTFTVNPLPSVISGTASACLGLTTTLTSAGGGTWASSDPSVATISTSGGVVYGVALGTSTITYTLPTGCEGYRTVTVNPVPSAITGGTSMCVDETTTLANPDAGGVWSSGNPTIATVSPTTGIVTGRVPGTALISYTRGGCPAVITVSVIALPGAITGTPSVCIGSVVTYTSATGGGSWSSGSTSTATIDPISGAFTGISSGTVIISYTVGTGCRVIRSVVVNPISPVTGPNLVCTGQYITLADTTMGGTWSSSNPAVATAAALTMGTGRVYGVSAGVVTITYTTVSGCRAFHTVSVQPSPAPILGNGSMCLGQTTTLSNTTGGGAWTSSDIFTAPVDAAGVVTGAAIGSADIYYTAGGCTVAKTVTVNPLPGLIAGSTNVCEGSYTTLSDPSGGGGTWLSSATTIATADPITGVVGGVLAGIAPVVYTLPTGCSTTINVTVDPLPSPITGSANVCFGYTTTLSNATPGGFWSSVNPSIASIDPSTGVVLGNGAGSTTIYYTLSATGCSVPFIVTVNNLPPAIGGPSAVCQGSQIVLTNTAAGGSWFSNDTTIATIGLRTGILTGVNSGFAQITYTVGTGCSVYKIVNVNPLPDPISGITSVCEGMTTVLTNLTGGGTWSSSSTPIATVDASGIVYGVLGGMATITYTLPTTCFVTTTVTVNRMPSVISGPTNLCFGTTDTMTNLVPGGTWSATAGILAIGGTSGIVTGTGVGPATVTYTLGAGCTATKPVNVVAPPTAYMVTGGGNFCDGGPGVGIGLAGSSVGVNYLLYLGSTAVGTFPGTGSALAFGRHTVAGTYRVIAVSAASGCSNTMMGTATVVVNPTIVPSIGIGATPDDTVCEGTSVTFNVLPVNGGSSPVYQWKVNGVNVGTSTSYSFIPAHGDVVRIWMRSNANCVAPDTAIRNLVMTVNGYMDPVATISPEPGDTVCRGDEVTITASNLYGGTAPSYTWMKNGVASGIGRVFRYVPTDGDIVYVNMTSNYPCRLSDTVNSADIKMHVDTQTVPEVNITANPGYMTWFGQSTTLTANVVKGGDYPTYQWVINGAPVRGATNATYTTTTFANNDSVSCLVTASGQCPVTSHAWMYMLVSPLGVGGSVANAGALQVLPNPNKGIFTIKGNLGMAYNGKIAVELTNMLGQVVYTETIVATNGQLNQQVQLPNTISNGMYLLNLKNGGDTKVFHIVVEK